jgi:hypothetical protein
MARSLKKYDPPKSLVIPSDLMPIFQAFSVESEKLAKVLLQQAGAAIYQKNREFSLDENKVKFSEEEIEGVYALMIAINPKDILETLHGVQIIVGHFLGMRKLSQPYPLDHKLGLKLLRMSSEAMERLTRKRNGGQQTVSVTYQNIGPSQQSLVTIPRKE